MARVVGHQAVIGGIVDAAKRQRRPQVIAFRGVVVDHVEDHLDTRLVKTFDHGLELADVIVGGRVAALRCKETDGVVTPVVAQPALRQRVFIDEGVDRHQFDGGDAQAAQVVDHRRRTQARVSAAVRFRDLRVQPGETAHVQLVDHGLVPGDARRAVVAPGEGGVDHLTTGHAGSAVARVEGQIGLLRAHLVAILQLAPVDAADDRFGIGVEQQLVRVEPLTMLGLVGTVDPIAVQQAGAGIGQVPVPDPVGLFGQRQAFKFALPAGIEQAEFHAFGVLREKREIDAATVPGGAQGVGGARPQAWRSIHVSVSPSAAGASRSHSWTRPRIGTGIHCGRLPNS